MMTMIIRIIMEIRTMMIRIKICFLKKMTIMMQINSEM